MCPRIQLLRKASRDGSLQRKQKHDLFQELFSAYVQNSPKYSSVTFDSIAIVVVILIKIWDTRRN